MDNVTGISIDTVEEIVTALPYLIGFYPADSLVVVTLHADPSGRARIGVTARMDLPTPEQHQALVNYLLTGPVQTVRPDAVQLFVITANNDNEASLPHHELITQLETELHAAHIPVTQAIWTPEIRLGAEWVSYDNPEIRGTVLDPQSSLLAAELTGCGFGTFASREQLCALLAPDDDGATAARWAVKLDGDALDNTRPPDTVAERIRAIKDVIDGIDQGQTPDEDTLLNVLTWLQDRSVREAMMSTALGERIHASESLWLTLVRRSPEPELAEPAVLLAVSTSIRGEGALARIALTRALEANPEHTFAQLFIQVLDLGAPPGEIAELIASATQPDAQR